MKLIRICGLLLQADMRMIIWVIPSALCTKEYLAKIELRTNFRVFYGAPSLLLPIKINESKVKPLSQAYVITWTWSVRPSSLNISNSNNWLKKNALSIITRFTFSVRCSHPNYRWMPFSSPKHILKLYGFLLKHLKHHL